jgi:hypothetical protein
MSIVTLDAPDFRTISDFRKRHLKALGKLFGQILQLCEKAGLVKLLGPSRRARARKATGYLRRTARSRSTSAPIGPTRLSLTACGSLRLSSR